MAFKRARARIGEKSTTPGSGPWTLAGAFDASYRAFSTFLSDGDSTEISAVEPGVAVWTGIGTYTAATNSIAPTTIEETFGTFGAGTKEIFAGALASRHLLREDISGAIITTGTSTAYSVASYRKYTSLSQLDGNIIAFTPHVTNGAGGVNLSVDGATFKPVRSAPGVDLPAGVLIQGTPYIVLYNNTDGAFYLQGTMYGNPYNIPIGASMDYWGATAPNSAMALMFGQALDRVTYATLFSVVGTSYGTGNGSTTFNIPDLRGRVVAGKDDMGGSAASRLSGTSITAGGGATTLGGNGGAETKTLITGNLPPYTPSGTITNGAITFSGSHNTSSVNGALGAVGTNSSGSPADLTSTLAPSQAASTFAGSAQGGVSTPIPIVQPTIIGNKLLRII